MIGGILVLALGMVVSLGMVLVGWLGMWIVHQSWRARGKFLSRGGRWVAASASVAVLGVLLFTLGAVLVGPSGLRTMQKANDSAVAANANKPPPAWLERIAPGASKRKPTAPPSPLVNTLFMVWGMGFVIVLLSAVYGSLAWAGAMLVGFGIRGYWPGP